MNTDYINDLDWLAFCYAAGELNDAEVEQFEARLADDQAAREALARAVELTQTVAAAETQIGDLVTPAYRVQHDWRRRVSWMAVGGVASLLAALLWSAVAGPTWHNQTWRKTNSGSRSQLAMAWNQTRSDFVEVREAALWSAASDFDDEGTDLAADEVPEAPSWMTAAVFNVSVESPTNPSSAQGLEQE
jgi:hypothetical protein